MTDRAQFIAARLARHFAPNSRLLEIGAGKGYVARALREAANVDIKLVDVVNYNETDLPLEVYDGLHLPYADNAFDDTLLIFVLHHTPDPLRVLGEALRVSKGGVVVVENHVQGRLRQLITRAIDSIPHLQYGVPICYHTHTIREWEELFSLLPVRAELLSRFTLDGFWQNFVMRLTCPTPD
jgi:ubiquinone/menaquinone biosynthesis C-methylase UbiE